MREEMVYYIIIYLGLFPMVLVSAIWDISNFQNGKQTKGFDEQKFFSKKKPDRKIRGIGNLFGGNLFGGLGGMGMGGGGSSNNNNNLNELPRNEQTCDQNCLRAQGVMTFSSPLCRNNQFCKVRKKRSCGGSCGYRKCCRPRRRCRKRCCRRRRCRSLCSEGLDQIPPCQQPINSFNPVPVYIRQTNPCDVMMPQPVSYLPTLAPITSSYSQPQQLPSYSQPQQLPTYSQPILSQPPSYTQPIAAPTYSQPAPTYSQPAPTYVQPASLEYQQPQIYSQQPCPSFYNVQPQVPYNPPQQLPYNQQTPYIPQMAYNPPPQTPYMSPQASPQLQPPFPEDPYSKLKPNDSTATNLKPFVSPGKAECVPTAINACPLETLPKDEPKNTMLPLSTNEKAKPLTEVKASSTTEEFDYHAAALDESKSPLEEVVISGDHAKNNPINASKSIMSEVDEEPSDTKTGYFMKAFKIHKRVDANYIK